MGSIVHTTTLFCVFVKMRDFQERIFLILIREEPEIRKVDVGRCGGQLARPRCERSVSYLVLGAYFGSVLIDILAHVVH